MRKEVPSEYIDKVIRDFKDKNLFQPNSGFNNLLNLIYDQYMTVLKKDTTPPLYRARIFSLRQTYLPRHFVTHSGPVPVGCSYAWETM